MATVIDKRTEKQSFGTVEARFSVKGNYVAGVDPASKNLIIHSTGFEVESMFFAYDVPVEVDRALVDSSGHAIAELKKGVSLSVNQLFNNIHEINLLFLHSILFIDGGVVKATTAHFPGDIAVFGKICAPLTIEPKECLMGHSATYQFEVSKDFTGKVEWGVTAIQGSTGGIGRINKETGLYTAPSDGEIHGTFTRVRITATDPASNYRSSGLVTIVRRDITANPVVQVTSATGDEPPQTRTLSANTLGQGVLEWKVVRGTGTIPLKGGPDGKNIYTPGPKDNNIDGTFTIDRIEVKNLATGKIQNAHVLVNHFASELTVTMDMPNSSLPNGKAKFKAVDNRDKEVTAIWKVEEGNGAIDSDGNFTVDPAGPDRYALITARTVDSGGYTDKDGWIIAPVPLVELPDRPIDTYSD
ncbi:hypothetical protein IMF27_04265 [Pseudomonas sp. PCH199]|uniref:hypothetical protein n=1 Tax=unclassified Pseudomonas TaxID=196821 RepID=UPI000BDC88D7|nr:MULTISPECIES: hypothetical protein [unclassified Pseudomonas]MCW8275011.1 hypothetical protein [Pseudomonas sp. PCH199]PAM84688.1 hypothetical protein CES87_04355 [Pseudomonas sp. ERMR1:02]